MTDQLKLFADTAAKIAAAPIRNGSLYFATDTRTLYIDMASKRTALGQVGPAGPQGPTGPQGRPGSDVASVAVQSSKPSNNSVKLWIEN